MRYFCTLCGQTLPCGWTLTLAEKVAMVAALQGEVIDFGTALRILMEASPGLHIVDAVVLLSDLPVAADDWTPLRDWDGGWPR